ncbi:hypothetical protein J2W27_000018 [Variovorax boronicumulans]|uniref:hypothetical protein n=1 Tax=Variovorax boronicumulans TaxID=436515 RepID=UPI00277E8686|nr:hypothetical protein [Variovorax boronicumulans]MDP9907925.1 hypothetical protein [Variovorax boronicumulans]
MGFHVGWISVNGKTPKEVQATLGLVETGEREFMPESELTGTRLPSGWYVIFLNDLAARELEDEVLANLSLGAEVMSFLIEEASMVSVAKGFSNGRLAWQVVHDSSQGLDHLETQGQLPESFAVVKDRLVGELKAAGQDQADYLFDVPAELSKSITGYRHDEDIEGVDEAPFSVLERRPG